MLNQKAITTAVILIAIASVTAAPAYSKGGGRGWGRILFGHKRSGSVSPTASSVSSQSRGSFSSIQSSGSASSNKSFYSIQSSGPSSSTSTKSASTKSSIVWRDEIAKNTVKDFASLPLGIATGIGTGIVTWQINQAFARRNMASQPNGGGSNDYSNALGPGGYPYTDLCREWINQSISDSSFSGQQLPGCMSAWANGHIGNSFTPNPNGVQGFSGNRFGASNEIHWNKYYNQDGNVPNDDNVLKPGGYPYTDLCKEWMIKSINAPSFSEAQPLGCMNAWANGYIL